MDLTPEEIEQAEALKAGWQVLCPAYRYIEPETEQLLGWLAARGIDVVRGVGASDIVRVRSRLATATLHARKKRVLWVDADQVVQPADALRMLLAKEPFVTAAAPSRIPPFRLLIDQKDPTQGFSLGARGGLLSIRHSGMGMVAHDVGLLERLAESMVPTSEGWYPFFLPMLVPRETAGSKAPLYLSEDYAFCERLTELGVELVADTRIRCWHIGTRIYRWEDVYFPQPVDQDIDLKYVPDEPAVEAAPEAAVEPVEAPVEEPSAEAAVEAASAPVDEKTTPATTPSGLNPELLESFKQALEHPEVLGLLAAQFGFVRNAPEPAAAPAVSEAVLDTPPPEYVPGAAFPRPKA